MKAIDRFDKTNGVQISILGAETIEELRLATEKALGLLETNKGHVGRNISVGKKTGFATAWNLTSRVTVDVNLREC